MAGRARRDSEPDVRGVRHGEDGRGGECFDDALSVLFSIFMNCLELLVAFLQAYVFTMLSAVFIGLAQERGGEADAGAEK